MGEIAIAGAPPPFDSLLPNRVFCRGERLIFANTSQLLALATQRDGTFERGYDLGAILEIAPDQREAVEITGFDVDRAGNVLLTSAVLFRAFEISAEGALAAAWGESGSARGTFGVVSGITRDEAGRTYVADKNRGVVMVFDASYGLIAEYAGEGRRYLALPSRLLLDRAGRLYVTQVGSRPVWVFDVRSN
jgi:DNA-binding beta-propeller fold protein YncE